MTTRQARLLIVPLSALAVALPLYLAMTSDASRGRLVAASLSVMALTVAVLWPWLSRRAKRIADTGRVPGSQSEPGGGRLVLATAGGVAAAGALREVVPEAFAVVGWSVAAGLWLATIATHWRLSSPSRAQSEGLSQTHKHSP